MRRSKVITLILFSLALLGGPSRARIMDGARGGKRDAASAVPVICFGDSITAGVGATPETRWEAVLQQLGAGRIRTINEGMSGRTLADAVSPRERGKFSNGRQEPLPPDGTNTLAQDVVLRHLEAEVLVIALGVNDLKNNRTDGADKSALALRNAATLIEQVRAVRPDLRIVLCCPANINPQAVNEINRSKKYDAQTHAWIKTLSVKFRGLAKSKRVAYCDLEPVVSPANYTDGLHPNEQGHRQIAEAVWKTLRKELGRRRKG
jgi:lysophospholipase L1-like esterase